MSHLEMIQCKDGLPPIHTNNPGKAPRFQRALKKTTPTPLIVSALIQLLENVRWLNLQTPRICLCVCLRHNSKPSGAERREGLAEGGSHRHGRWRASLYCQVSPPRQLHEQRQPHPKAFQRRRFICWSERDHSPPKAPSAGLTRTESRKEKALQSRCERPTQSARSRLTLRSLQKHAKHASEQRDGRTVTSVPQHSCVTLRCVPATALPNPAAPSVTPREKRNALTFKSSPCKWA